MPVSSAGWSVKAKVRNRRARVAEAAHKELPAGGVRYPRSLCFGRGPNKRRGPDYRITWPREIVARERRRALARRNVLIPRREGGVKAWRRSLM
jgi:hypothetical protein